MYTSMENNYQNPQENPQANLAYKPSNNMVWAVLTTIFCCLPFGIPAIVFAARVDSLWFSGRHQEAYNAARVSRNWALISAIVAIVGWILYIAFFAAFFEAIEEAEEAAYYDSYYYY